MRAPPCAAALDRRSGSPYHGGGMKIIVDATCPVVTRVHALAKKLADEGYQVIAFGDHGHPEMVTLKELLGDRVTVVHSREEAAAVKIGGKLGVVSQTTQ